MVKQKIIGPFILDEGRKFSFYQNPTSNGNYSDGYSIRYFSNTCGNKNGWVSLGTVKEPYIETAKQTLFNYYRLVEKDQEEFIYYCKGNFRRNISTLEIDVGIKRRVNSEWIPLINSYIDGLFEKEKEEMEEEIQRLELR